MKFFASLIFMTLLFGAVGSQQSMGQESDGPESEGQQTAGLPSPNPNATFTWIHGNIIEQKCMGCHGRNGYPQFNAMTYKGVIAKVDMKTFTPEQSTLYIVTAPGGAMPPSCQDNNSCLTADDLATIADWIRAGAPND